MYAGGGQDSQPRPPLLQTRARQGGEPGDPAEQLLRDEACVSRPDQPLFTQHLFTSCPQTILIPHFLRLYLLIWIYFLWKMVKLFESIPVTVPTGSISWLLVHIYTSHLNTKDIKSSNDALSTFLYLLWKVRWSGTKSVSAHRQQSWKFWMPGRTAFFQSRRSRSVQLPFFFHDSKYSKTWGYFSSCDASWKWLKSYFHSLSHYLS